jgi:hypothetical protein
MLLAINSGGGMLIAQPSGHQTAHAKSHPPRKPNQCTFTLLENNAIVET